MAYKLTRFRNAPYIYKWSERVAPLLPNHYKKRCLEFMNAEPLAVHWEYDPRKYKIGDRGQRIRVQNLPVKVIYPEHSNKELWGGEGIVVGWIKRKKYSTRTPKIWKPYLLKRPLYSEIFDKFYVTTVTLRTLDLIDENFGFDYYILKTDEASLNSELAMSFKRGMLIRLSEMANKPAKYGHILKRYDQFIIPRREADWVGLPTKYAVAKAIKLHEKRNPTLPLKEVFIKELLENDGAPVQEIEEEQDEKKEGSWLKNIKVVQTIKDGLSRKKE